MALPGSGTLALSDIQTEFGGSNPISITEYYGADTGVPTSGTISISDFYGTASGPPLPPVIDIYDSATHASGGPGSVTLDATGVGAGEYICIFCAGDSGACGTPTGFTSYTLGTPPTSVVRYFFYKVASGSETTISVSTTFAPGVFFMFTCTTIQNPTEATGSTGMPDPPSAGIGIGEYSVIIGFLDDGNAVTMTAPSGYTLIEELHLGSGSPDGFAGAIAYHPTPNLGTTNPAAFGGGGSDNWSAFHLEIS